MPDDAGMETQAPPLTIRQAKHQLNVSDDTLRRYLTAGTLRGFRLPSGVWRIPISEIERIRTGSNTQERG